MDDAAIELCIESLERCHQGGVVTEKGEGVGTQSPQGHLLGQVVKAVEGVGNSGCFTIRVPHQAGVVRSGVY